MTILNRIASFFSTDVVKLSFNDSDDQIYSEAIPMRANINRTSQQFVHPLEDRSVITDHRIINPDEVTLLMTIPNGLYKDVYPQIKSAWLNGELLQVTTRADTFLNLVIQNMPHEEGRKFNAIDIVLELKETQFSGTEVAELTQGNVDRIDQATSISRGVQNGIALV